MALIIKIGLECDDFKPINQTSSTRILFVRTN